MDEQVLVRIATNYAKQHGYDTDDYSVTSVLIKNGVCWILFQGKSGLPGDHFTVTVDISTGLASELFPGE